MRNSPLKQNYSKKRGKAAQLLDPAGFFHKSEAPPAIVDPSGETSAFKMKGYPYPGKSPLNQLGPAEWGIGKIKHAVSGAWDAVKAGGKRLMKSDFAKDVAVGAVVGKLSKPKKQAKTVRIIGGKDQEEENRIA